MARQSDRARNLNPNLRALLTNQKAPSLGAVCWQDRVAEVGLVPKERNWIGSIQRLSYCRGRGRCSGQEIRVDLEGEDAVQLSRERWEEQVALQVPEQTRSMGLVRQKAPIKALICLKAWERLV